MTRPWERFTAEQRRAAFLVDRSVVSAAAAGSGKTQVLAVRYCACLLRDEAPLGPDRVLAITFTREAAAQLRQRIGAVIAAILAEDHPAFPDYRGHGGEDAELGEAEIAHLREALAALPSAAIGTVDSFCLDLVGEHADRLERDPGLAPPDEGPAWESCREEAWQLLRAEQLEARGGELGELLAAYADPQLKPLLQGLVERSLSLPADAVAAVETDAEAMLIARRGPQLRALAAAVAAAKGVVIGGGKGASEIARLPALVPEPGEQLKVYLRCCDQMRAVGGDAAKAAIRAIHAAIDHPCVGHDGRPSAQARRAAASLAAYAHADADHQGVLRGRASAAAAVVRRLRELLIAVSRRRGLAGFGDTARCALDLVRMRGVAAQVAGRFRHILLDEAQDLSRLQGAIIEALWAAEPRPRVFAVGDLRQSIYRFRHAEPAQFRRWEDTVADLGGVVAPLGANFRSEPLLVATVRSWFAQPTLAEAFRPHEIQPGREARAESAVRLWQVDADEAGAATAARIAAIIAASVAGGRRPAEHAVILRARTRMRLYADALERVGLPVDTDFPGGLFDAQECWDVEAVLRLCLCPHDRFALACAASGPWGMPDPQDRSLVVRALSDPDPGAAAAAILGAGALGGLIARIAPILRAEGPAQAIAALARDPVLVARYAGLPLARRRLANTARLAHEARDSGLDAAGLIARWNDRRRLGADHAEASGSALGAQGVRLLTIHGSKGLEWPVVVLPELERRFEARDLSACVLGSVEEDGLMLTCGPGSQEKGPALARALAGEAIAPELVAEEARLLYVACTRAVTELHLISAAAERAVAIRAPLDWILAAGGTFAAAEPAAPAPARMPAAAGQGAALPELEAASAPSIGAIRGITELIAALRPAPVRSMAAPDPEIGARALGRAVHRLLEDHGWGASTTEIERALAGISGVAAQTLTLVRAALGSELLRRGAADRDELREQPFVAELARGDASRLVVGVPDLVLQEQDGSWRVVDFKTGASAGDEADRLQVRLYAELLAPHLGAISSAAILDLRRGAWIEVRLEEPCWHLLSEAWAILDRQGGGATAARA